MKFSKYVSEGLVRRGWSQADLAREADLSRQAVSFILNGRSKTPDLETIMKIAKAFKEPLENVLRSIGVLPIESNQDAWLRRMQHKLATAKNEQERKMIENMIDLVLPDMEGDTEAKKRHGTAPQHL